MAKRVKKEFVEDSEYWQRVTAERRNLIRANLNDVVMVLDLGGFSDKYITGRITNAPEQGAEYTIIDGNGKKHTFLYANLQDIKTKQFTSQQ